MYPSYYHGNWLDWLIAENLDMPPIREVRVGNGIFSAQTLEREDRSKFVYALSPYFRQACANGQMDAFISKVADVWLKRWGVDWGPNEVEPDLAVVEQVRAARTRELKHDFETNWNTTTATDKDWEQKLEDLVYSMDDFDCQVEDVLRAMSIREVPACTWTRIEPLTTRRAGSVGELDSDSNDGNFFRAWMLEDYTGP